MARPRSNRPPVALETAAHGIDNAALEEAGRALTERGNQLRTIDMQFAVEGEYSFAAIDQALPAMMAMHASAVVWLGRALILVREHESEDVFREFIARHELAPRAALKYMQVALKIRDRPALERLGVTKALELMSEDDDTLDALAAGGTLAGLTLDELDTMSVRELKEALRAERRERAEEKSTDEEIIRAKDERINKLTRERNKSASERQVRQRADELLRDADDAAVEATSQLSKLRSLFGDVDRLFAEAGLAIDPDVADRLEANARWAAEQLRELAAQLGE